MKTAATGFTLTEVMIATGLFSLAVGGALSVFIMCLQMWHATSLSLQTSRECNLAISRLVYGLGTNSGLRSASMVELISNNVYGHPYPWNAAYEYWNTGNTPPAAADSTHYAHVGCGHGSDGSWRLIMSNRFDGVMCVDFNKRMRNILFCPDTNQTSAAREKRILICNFVSNAVISTNAAGVNIQVTVFRRDGRFAATNLNKTFVTMRNRQQ